MRYDGKMDRGSREIAVATFKKPGGPKVLLLRCVCGRDFGRCDVLMRCLAPSVVPWD